MKRLILILTLVGCSQIDATQPTIPSLPSEASDTCGARQYAQLIGADATALERVLILGQVRLIRPGTAITMDFRTERINFNISADEIITGITCG